MLLKLTPILFEGETSGTITSAVNTAISDGADQVKSVISTNAPILLGVAVATVLVMVGIKWIKRIKPAA